MRFLLSPDGSYLIFSQKTWIGFALCDELFCKTLIYWTAAALGIASVSSGFSVRTGAFIKIYAKKVQGVYDDVNRTIHISFVIRVLYAQIEYASGLMGQPLIGKGSEKVTQMDESCRAGSKTGDFGLRRKLARRKHFFIFLRSLFHIRKKKLP